MAEDWAANVKKYVPDADDGTISGIVRYCGIALQKRDSSLVSFGDAAETKRVRENFLKKKLALTDSDDTLDAAIAKVGERMKGENFRNRVTVYYLLAEQFGKLQVFAKAAKAAKAPAASKKPAAGSAAAAGVAAVAGLASLSASAAKPKAAKAKPDKVAGVAAGAAGAVAAGAISGAKVISEKAADVAEAAISSAKAASESAADGVGTVAARALSGVKAVGETAVGTVASGAKAVGGNAIDAAGAAGAAVAGAAGAAAAKVGSGASNAAQALKGNLSDDKDESNSGLGWLLWLALIVVVLGVLWWLFYGKPAAPIASSVTTEQSAAPSSSEAAAPPVEGTVAIPTGAGVTTESRDGKPVVKVYFATGRTDIVPAFGPAATGLKAYLDSHAGSTLTISGYNDRTGNASANAALSKKRAQAVQTALVASGVAETAAKLVKPADTTDARADDAAARRVEVLVQ